jgi:hypothetical protein
VRVLFIVKKRQDYCAEYSCDYSYTDLLGGLYNSARFVVQMLNNQPGTVASVVLVTDANDIDREVTAFKPDVVIIEALWVPPAKFPVLSRLHPKVKWVVRIHSEIPFLSLEGIALGYLSAYAALPTVTLAANAVRATLDLQNVLTQKGSKNVVEYLPNWYPSTVRHKPPDPTRPPIRPLNIGCFGAIRPFKNQLAQALAAMEFATTTNRVLHFHINSSRCEQDGSSVLKNLRALFARTKHTLIEHSWETHADFLTVIAGMDAEMGVSFSETFNIVIADAVTNSVPVVVSEEISWVDPQCYADPNSVPDMAATLMTVTTDFFRSQLLRLNLRNLETYDKTSQNTWLLYLKNV